MSDYNPFLGTYYYHYCSTSTFIRIIEDHTILCSDLRLSNDSMEGEWIAEVLEKLIHADSELRPYAEEMTREVRWLADYFGALGFCMSKEGDMLSQWRGYADDGRGFSIGFNRGYCQDTANFTAGETTANALVEVDYDALMQQSILQGYLERVRPFIKAGAYKTVRGVSILSTKTSDQLEEESKSYGEARLNVRRELENIFHLIFKFKNPAFREEDEVRILYHKIGRLDFKFFPKSDRIVPAKLFSLKKDRQAIGHVVIGPKNLTSKKTVELALEANGWSNILISESSATYR